MVTVEEISRLWPLACEDAGYQPQADALLYVVPGDSGNGPAALHVEPGRQVVVDTQWPLAPNQVADANRPDHRDLHRVLVRDFLSPRIALGRLRHELEHGRQYDRSTEVYLAMSFARDALSRDLGVYDPPSWDGSGLLYNLLPPEEDANRAAARLTIRHLGPPTDAELASDGALFRDQSPVEADTLALRILAFMALFPEGVRWVAEQRDETVVELLDHLGPDASYCWGVLEEHPEVAAFGHAAIERCPSVEEIAAAGSTPGQAWVAAKEQIGYGKAAAESLLSGLPVLSLN